MHNKSKSGVSFRVGHHPFWPSRTKKLPWMVSWKLIIQGHFRPMIQKIEFKACCFSEKGQLQPLRLLVTDEIIQKAYINLRYAK